MADYTRADLVSDILTLQEACDDKNDRIAFLKEDQKLKVAQVQYLEAKLTQRDASIARQELIIVRLLSQLKTATDRITELTK